MSHVRSNGDTGETASHPRVSCLIVFGSEQQVRRRRYRATMTEQPRARARATANPNVTFREYRSVLEKHYAVSNSFSFAEPFVSEAWKVTPAMLVNASSLMQDLVDAGVGNGVLRNNVFEAEALRLLCAKLRPDQVKEGQAASSKAHEFTEHVKSLFSVLRTYHQESRKGKYKKTGSLRRRMVGSEMLVVNGLSSSLALHDGEKETGEGGRRGTGGEEDGRGRRRRRQQVSRMC